MHTPRVIPPRDASARRSGFALVVALSLMAFILVLLLTLTSLVRVETSSAQNQLAQLQARQNARLGAMVALGELQKAMGPDTRVSAPTLDEFAPANTQWIVSAFDSAPYVYDASGNLIFNERYTQRIRPLVSLDDPTTFDPATFQPLLANGRPADDFALLVGPGSTDPALDSDADTIPDGFVAAQLVDIEENQEIGAFAWWVADEGMKAQVNVTDPFRDSINPAEVRARATTAQRVGTEAIFGNYDPDNDSQNALLSRVDSPRQLSLVTGLESTSGQSRRFFHDITTGSNAILTNTRRGGLMKDLTAVIKEAEANSGDVNFSGPQWTQLISHQENRLTRWREETEALEALGGAQPATLQDRHWNALNAITLRGPGAPGNDQSDPRLANLIFPPLSDLHTQFDQGGAPWQQLITWPTLLQRRGAIELEPQGRWRNTMEVTPVIAKVSISAYATVDYPEIALHMVPYVVLWNPYDKPIRVAAGSRVVVSYARGNLNFYTRLRVSHPSWNVNSIAYTGNSDDEPNRYAHIPNSSRNSGSLLFTPVFDLRWNPVGALTAHKDQFVFSFRSSTGEPDLIIQPGQARIFAMHEHIDVTPSTPGGNFSPEAELIEGLPDATGQFGLFLRENIELQMDNHVTQPHPDSSGDDPNSISGQREAIRGYNRWHGTGKGGGNSMGPPQAMPYPFPLSHPVNDLPGDPTRLTGDGANLVYAAADAPPDGICVNKNYLRGWEIEEVGMELGGMGNHGTRSLEGVSIRLDQGLGTTPMTSIHNLNAISPHGLTFARLSDVDNDSINNQTGQPFSANTIALSVPAIRTPSTSSPLDFADFPAPLWGLSYGLRLPENAYNYDVATGGAQGAMGSGLATPARWMVDMNPVAPYPGRDPSSRNVTNQQVNNLGSVGQKGGFQSPIAYSGGFFMLSDRLSDPLASTPDEFNQFIGATDAANPSWMGGAPRAIIYEIPAGSEDLGSVASLMHAPLSPTSHALMPHPSGLPGPWSGLAVTDRDLLPYWLNVSSANYGFMQPTYTIGNSRAHLMVQREKAIQSFYPSASFPNPSDHSESIPYASTTNPVRHFYATYQGSGLHRGAPASFFPGYDSSWVYNEVLWDDFFFTPRSNNRMAWSGGAHPDDNSGSSVERDFHASAQNVVAQGAFNINSTSIPAWAALLSSTMGVDLGSGGASSDTSLFNRFLVPSAGVFDNSTDDYYSASAYGGYRRLAAEEIWDNRGTPFDYSDDDGLAVEIVNQIKARGPFLSLSDFVNRALISSAADTDNIGLAGALQTAIDLLGINTALGDASDSLSWIDPTVEMDLEWHYTNEGDRAFDGLSVENLNFWTRETASGVPILAEGVQRNANSSGELTQADILSRIGAVIRPRSDYFTVRAKGITGNANDPDAKAWCELTIQRVPDYVDNSANNPDDLFNSLVPSNQKFGRRFEIVSFRWLDESEI